MAEKSQLTPAEKKVRELAVQQEENTPQQERIFASERTVTVKYLTRAGKPATRPFKLYIPRNGVRPMPLVFVAHYPMAIAATEMQSYFRNGWAVGVTDGFEDVYNRDLAGDNLICNNAALWTLRHQPEIDPNRVAVVGGSAGGYTTMMLLGLHANICCGSANAPIANLYFNMHRFFPEAYGMYLQARAGCSLDELARARRLSASAVQSERYAGMSMLPLPVLASIAESFLHVNDRFPPEAGENLYEALSPVGLGACYTAPFLLRHFTSDGLVPFDQISKRYSYKQVGSSLPAGFNPLLPREVKGKLDMSLEEALPPEKTTICFGPVLPEVEYPEYDPEKPFLLRLFDEGPMESFSGHRLVNGTGGASEERYLAGCLAAGAAETVWLTPEKLALLLDRWLGNSVQLPTFPEAPAEYYGSLSCARLEVTEELQQYVSARGISALTATAEALWLGTEASEKTEARKLALQRICGEMDGSVL